MNIEKHYRSGMRWQSPFLLATLCYALLWPQLAAATESGLRCADLTGLTLADVQIVSAERERTPVRHCKVRGMIGGKIGFSVWLPRKWNQRFAMGGAGGFVSSEDNQAMRFGNALRKGYATASSDTGHTGDGLDGSWALNDLEAIVNYGHLGMHRTVVAVKEVIRQFYGTSADKAFFLGCSNGGRQALQEAQRYPDDFDAIIAGAPALNFTGIATAFLDITRHMYPDPQAMAAPLITKADRALLRRGVEARCDARDGVVDGVLNAPQTCDFNPAELACGADATTDCLAPAKIAAINSVYRGPQSEGAPLFFGFPFGAEATDANGWGTWFTGGVDESADYPSAAYAFGVGFLRYFVAHDPEFDYHSYDLAQLKAQARPTASALHSDNPDLDAFRARGGKLLLFHGWADVALSAHMSIDYVQRVFERTTSARDDVRLFLLPGMLHCSGGAGPSRVAWLDVLANWHDTGAAPNELNVGYPLPRQGARKICAWPEQARYRGGPADLPSSYTCSTTE